jgi:hypothetical protein
MSQRLSKFVRPAVEGLEDRLPPSAALPQPQPPGQVPSGNPPTAPGGSNDPRNSSQLSATWGLVATAPSAAYLYG